MSCKGQGVARHPRVTASTGAGWQPLRTATSRRYTPNRDGPSRAGHRSRCPSSQSSPLPLPLPAASLQPAASDGPPEYTAERGFTHILRRRGSP